jgi:hypothetical protein
LCTMRAGSPGCRRRQAHRADGVAGRVGNEHCRHGVLLTTQRGKMDLPGGSSSPGEDEGRIPAPPNSTWPARGANLTALRGAQPVHRAHQFEFLGLDQLAQVCRARFLEGDDDPDGLPILRIESPNLRGFKGSRSAIVRKSKSAAKTAPFQVNASGTRKKRTPPRIGLVDGGMIPARTRQPKNA